MHHGMNPRDFVIGDQSPFTGSREVMHRYHQWHAILTWNHLKNFDYWRLFAHFCASDGGRILFQIPIFGYRAKVGTKTGTVNLSGAHSAGATSLTITGGSGQLLRGDWVQFNPFSGVPYAHIVTSSESGGVIQIRPGLREALTGSQVHHFGGGGYLFDTMELPPDPSFASAMPSPLPGLFQPFTIELVTALRVTP
jgi:hypothetical protein